MKLTQRLLAHNKRLLFVAISYTILVTVLCLRSAKILLSIAKGFDKIGHASFHFGMVIVWFLYLKFRIQHVDTAKVLMQSLIISFIFGVGIEFCQENFTLSRTADVKDVYANFIGALIAAATIVVVKKFGKQNWFK